MKGTKEQRGITLIALIITIVVLLILAAVAISSIQNDGILHYAQNAADSWNKAAQNEAGILDGYLGYLNPCLEKGHTYGAWVTVTQADCSTETNGSRERACGVCGNKETQTINYCHVNPSDWEGNCEECGKVCNHTIVDEEWTYDGNYQHRRAVGLCLHCYVCDTVETEKCNYVDEICTVCGHEMPEHEHKYNDYNSNGNKVCSLCGKEYVCERHNVNNEGECSECSYKCPSHCVSTYLGTWVADPSVEYHYSSVYCSECDGFALDEKLCYPQNDIHPDCTICNPQ